MYNTYSNNAIGSMDMAAVGVRAEAEQPGVAEAIADTDAERTSSSEGEDASHPVQEDIQSHAPHDPTEHQKGPAKSKHNWAQAYPAELKPSQ